MEVHFSDATKQKIKETLIVLSRVLVLVILGYCLWICLPAGILIIILGKFIIDLEDRISALEKQIKEEKEARLSIQNLRRYT